jgi:hypothetical protein
MKKVKLLISYALCLVLLSIAINNATAGTGWEPDSIGIRLGQDWEEPGQLDTDIRVFGTIKYNNTHYLKLAHTRSNMDSTADFFSSDVDDTTFLEYVYKF